MAFSRDLQDLHPLVERKARRFISACADHNIELIILCTWRDADEQAKRYAMGRTEKGVSCHSALPMGHVITDNPPGFSFHHYRLALDVWPIVNNRVVIDWQDPDYPRAWRVMRNLAADRSINLRDGADHRLFTGRREWGHYHYSAGLSIEAIRAGEKLPDVDL